LLIFLNFMVKKFRFIINIHKYKKYIKFIFVILVIINLISIKFVIKSFCFINKMSTPVNNLIFVNINYNNLIFLILFFFLN